MKKISKSFLWGASTSAYQFEGGYNSDGKGPSIQDEKEIINKETSDFKIASDHYNHWKEDVALMREMGFKSYRFSISWTRIIPNGIGKVNQKGIEFYSNLINELLKNKIEPIVTMFHFDMPNELEKIGGWANRKVINAYVNYANILFDNFGDRIKYWITINEQNVLLLQGPIVGIKRPENCNVLQHVFQMNHNITVAQALVMQECHKRFTNKVKIGTAPNISSIYPASCKPEDVIASKNIGVLKNWFYLDIIVKGYYNRILLALLEEQNAMFEIKAGDMEIIQKANPDFIAFNYYTTTTVKMNEKIANYKLPIQERIFGFPGFGETVSNKNLNKTQFGWEIDPKGLKVTLLELQERYNLPVIITENGIGAYDKLENEKIIDDYRIAYLKSHIEAIKEAVNEGSQIFGYNCWSAFDLVSVHEGISKRYGLIYIDRDEKNIKEAKRIRKKSSYWYEQLIRSNGEKL
ncbi:glycoside hydrolase family 1 protein [Spiroplasma endosymbiont of Cantharis rufa]|uniref:glycoside hydrolase family 1 protein n=1 Tax=Spiroplasma endosymbiont of Cantharis rufa TaxID=3066279 RepID=UPI0030D34DA8